jgi:hypothetical protein
MLLVYTQEGNLGTVTNIYYNLDNLENIEGFTADTIPVPTDNGLVPVLKIDLLNDFLFYDYVNPPEQSSTRLELLEQESTLLKAQNSALADRAEFIEELIAEMAMLLYS